MSFTASVDNIKPPHLQAPGLLHILPEHVLPQAVEQPLLEGRVGSAVAGPPECAGQPIRLPAEELTQLGRPAVGLAARDAVGAVELLLYGVVVEAPLVHQGEHIATQTAQALAQQEEAVRAVRQHQLPLSVPPCDAAVVEGQLGCGVGGHGGGGVCGQAGLTLNLKWSLKRWRVGDFKRMYLRVVKSHVTF